MCLYFITLIPAPRCQCTCSSTHQDVSEPAIIFLQALSWPQAYSTGGLLYQLTPPAAACITELHSWLQMINTKQSGHFRGGSVCLGGDDCTNGAEARHKVSENIITLDRVAICHTAIAERWQPLMLRFAPTVNLDLLAMRQQCKPLHWSIWN